MARPQRARCDIGAFEVPASSWYVAKSGNDANDCLSPATACATIGAAIGKAAAGDPISVAAGFYRENLSVDKNLALNGAGTRATIIDGGGTGSVLTVGSAISATISGVTIQNGQSLANGGGVANNGTLTLEQSIVVGNTAAQEGGGVDNNGTLFLVKSTISGNRAGAGGGIHNNGFATLTIENSTISGNSAGTGGGILNGGSLSIEASTLSGNQATASDGGLWIGGGSLSMINSTISGNRAADGAGLLVGTQPVELTNDTIAENNASKAGGGISNTSSVPLNLANTILAGNSAPTGPDCAGALVSRGGNIVGSAAGCAINVAPSDEPRPADVVGADPRVSPLRDNGGPTFTHALLAGSPALDASASNGFRRPTRRCRTAARRGLRQRRVRSECGQPRRPNPVPARVQPAAWQRPGWPKPCAAADPGAAG